MKEAAIQDLTPLALTPLARDQRVIGGRLAKSIDEELPRSAMDALSYPGVGVSPQLLQRLRARDTTALTGVVDAFARRLYTTARALGFAPSDAEDLAQEVFTTFLSTIDRFEGRSSLSTWLFGILYHKAQERRRVAARTVAHDPSDAVFESWFDARGRWIRPPVSPDAAIHAHEVAAALDACLAQLPELQRLVFQLRQVEELTAAEAGEVLGTTVTHVGVLLHRARTRLRECLGRKGWGGSP